MRTKPDASVRRPDLEELLRPLKDFQRRTVDHAFERLFLRESGSGRYLVADEVGLGKTLVARGVIARAIDALWDSVGRIDVVYVCSNAAIARANIAKLAMGDHEALPATRLTLLPEQLEQLRERREAEGRRGGPKVLFTSFTPGTALELSGTGRMEERRVLHSLLTEIYGDYAWITNLLQGGVDPDRWRKDYLRAAPNLDRKVVQKFKRQVSDTPGLKRHLRDARVTFARRRQLSDHDQSAGWELIGDLRSALATVCIELLEPDLIILDEFQRFSDLLRERETTDEAPQLAQRLFHYRAPEGHPVRLLLLSATPYPHITTDLEAEAQDHYEDFVTTTEFLLNDPPRSAEFRQCLRGFARGIRQLAADPTTVDRAALSGHRDALQRTLSEVMSRTERVRSTADRNAMAEERVTVHPLEVADVEQFALADAIAEAVGEPAPVEYWKAAPHLPSFMPGYVLKKRLIERLRDRSMVDTLQNLRGQLLRWGTIGTFQPVEPGSPRLRAMIEDFLGNARSELLWVPPTLPYWTLGGAFRENSHFTKGLVFSAWRVVPDAVSALVSYEAERRSGDMNGMTYSTLRKKRGALLNVDGESMAAASLQLPSLTLADEVDPAVAWGRGQSPADVGREWVRARLAELPAAEGRVDDRWYWAAPLLLDRGRPGVEAALSAWNIASERRNDTGKGLARARELALQMLRGVPDEPLRRRPDDLVDVITEMALAAPATVAARSLRRDGLGDVARWQAAAAVGEGFRTLFNRPTARGIVERRYGSWDGPDRVPYWRAVLRYGLDGCLQALLDELVHLEWEQVEWSGAAADTLAANVAQRIASAAAVVTGGLNADTFTVRGGKAISRREIHLRTGFAMRYAAVTGDAGDELVREDAVRTAFNSPFHPFLMVTTSVGQEGLDFHPWCHAVYHWNLPGNPVDLEQREGRVNRYKGHALRRNVAHAHRNAARTRVADGERLWDVLFGVAREAAAATGASELVPYWVHDGPFKVQRRVPLLPCSSERESLARLKRDLARYRVAFGQPRQEELLELLARANLTDADLEPWILDLSVKGP